MKRLGILLVLMLTTVSYSQYYEGNTVIAWSKYKFKPVSEVDGYKAGDRGKALLEYHTARNAKTKLLQSSLFLTHYWTGKVTDVNFVNEFKNMEDATLYSGTGGDLNEKTWPNEDERKAAVSGSNKYFQRYHEDVHLFENRKKLEKKKKKSKDNPNTVVAVTTRYWKPLSQVEGGSSDERDKLMQKYHKKVTMKNDKIISQLNKNLNQIESGVKGKDTQITDNDSRNTVYYYYHLAYIVGVLVVVGLFIHLLVQVYNLE